MTNSAGKDVHAWTASDDAALDVDTEHLALDRAVPVRKVASLDGAPFRAAFLVGHVDGRSNVREIAAAAQLPLAEVIESFLLLADLGVIALGPAPAAPRAPANDGPRRSPSGVRAKP